MDSKEAAPAVAPAPAPAPPSDASTPSKNENADPTPSPPPAQPANHSPDPAQHNHSQKPHKWKNHNHNPPPPTNCVVLKNLDYNITQVTLEEVVRRVTGGRTGFVNIALIDDKATGSFRGMAFVNFHTTHDATVALAELSKMVINGRKVIAEYRRLRPGERERKEQQEKRAKKFDSYNYNNRQTFEKDIPATTDANGKSVDKRAAFFAKRDTVKKADEQKRSDERAERDKEREAAFRKLLLEYGEGDLEDGMETPDLMFDCSLTSYERRMVHIICSELGLGHISRVDEEGSRVLHVTKDPVRTVEWEKETAELKAETRRQAQEQKRKQREENERKKAEPVSASPPTKDELQGINWFKPRAAMATNTDSEGASSNGIRGPSYKIYVPPHKPKGPDGTIGFSSRAKTPVDGDADQETEVANEDCDGTLEKDAVNDSDDAANGVEDADDAAKGNRKSGKGSHTVLNPSVPAFSPSFTPSY